MANLGDFDASTVEPNQAFDLIPDGWIEAMIVESETKATAAGTGEYLKLKLAILDTRYPNRFLWDNLNLKNPNEKTVQIARGTLSAICRAVNVLKPRDSSQLHNLPMLIKVGHEVRKDTQEMQNKVKGYKAKESTVAPTLSQAQSVPTPAPTPAAAGSAPWTKKVS